MKSLSPHKCDICETVATLTRCQLCHTRVCGDCLRGSKCFLCEADHARAAYEEQHPQTCSRCTEKDNWIAEILEEQLDMILEAEKKDRIIAEKDKRIAELEQHEDV